MLLCCWAGCSSQNKQALFVMNPNGSQCENKITISEGLEPDRNFNRLLSAYLYNALIGGYDCKSLTDQNLQKLYQRPSFKKAVLQFYTDPELQKLNPYDDERQWTDRYPQLLYGIKDLALLHEIANELLALGKFDGATALWDKAKIDQLPNLKTYQQLLDEKNFFACAELAAFYQVNHQPGMRDKYLSKARNASGFESEYEDLRSLLKSGKPFSYEAYQEAVLKGI